MDKLSNTTHSLHGIVEIGSVDHLSIKQPVLTPSDLSASLLVNQQPAPELFGLHVKEASQLLQVHGRVQTEVGLDSGAPHVGLHLIHEDLKVVLDRVDVELWVVEVWGGG